MAIVWARVAWAANTAYMIGARVTNASVVVDGVGLPAVYECAAPGTSANAGPGPTGTDLAVPIVDGGVTWRYKGPFGGEVVGLGAQFADLPALEQSTILDAVDTSVPLDVWGSRTDAASLYLAAHLASLSLNEGKGSVTQEQVGDLKRAYTPMIGESDLEMTGFGRTFLRWQRDTGAGIGFTVC